LKIFLVSGFLGSGKTTLSLLLAKRLVERDKKVAVIVNEVGEVGIDSDLFVNFSETQIFELFSGCVCCQMGHDLIKALNTISEMENIDAVVLEPSGVALPSQIIETIRCWSENVTINNIVLVDGTRFMLLWEELEHIMGDAIFSADMIVVSKIDKCEAREVQGVLNKLKELCPNVPILPVNLLAESPPTFEEVFCIE